MAGHTEGSLQNPIRLIFERIHDITNLTDKRTLTHFRFLRRCRRASPHPLSVGSYLSGLAAGTVTSKHPSKQTSLQTLAQNMMALSVRQSARQQSSSSSSSRASTNTRYRRALQSSRRSRHGVRATTDARMATEQADRPGDANDDANNSQAVPETPNLLGMARNTVKKASAPFSKVLDGNERLIARHRRTVKAINALEEEYASLSVEALLRKTSEFRARLNNNEDTLDSLLPEAFAALREHFHANYAAHAIDFNVAATTTGADHGVWWHRHRSPCCARG